MWQFVSRAADEDADAHDVLSYSRSTNKEREDAENHDEVWFLSTHIHIGTIIKLEDISFNISDDDQEMIPF